MMTRCFRWGWAMALLLAAPVFAQTARDQKVAPDSPYAALKGNGLKLANSQRITTKLVTEPYDGSERDFWLFTYGPHVFSVDLYENQIPLTAAPAQAPFALAYILPSLPSLRVSLAYWAESIVPDLENETLLPYARSLIVATPEGFQIEFLSGPIDGMLGDRRLFEGDTVGLLYRYRSLETKEVTRMVVDYVTRTRFGELMLNRIEASPQEFDVALDLGMRLIGSMSLRLPPQ